MFEYFVKSRFQTIPGHTVSAAIQCHSIAMVWLLYLNAANEPKRSTHWVVVKELITVTETNQTMRPLL